MVWMSRALVNIGTRAPVGHHHGGRVSRRRAHFLLTTFACCGCLLVACWHLALQGLVVLLTEVLSWIHGCFCLLLLIKEELELSGNVTT